MVLSAKALGIEDESLIPFFCCSCGNRIGWTREDFGEELSQVYCEDCAKQQPEENDED